MSLKQVRDFERSLSQSGYWEVNSLINKHYQDNISEKVVNAIDFSLRIPSQSILQGILYVRDNEERGFRILP